MYMCIYMYIHTGPNWIVLEKYETDYQKWISHNPYIVRVDLHLHTLLGFHRNYWCSTICMVPRLDAQTETRKHARA